MPEIRPFAALRYDPTHDLSRVTCPPYDVLSADARRALAERSPVAAARLILPDGDGDAKYDNAAALLAEWQANGVLARDTEPGFYVTRTVFDEPGTRAVRKTRLGLVCLLRASEYGDGDVLPHERTLDAPKADRVKLLRATRANVESILCLARDDNGELQRALEGVTKTETPLCEFDGDDHERHTLWRVGDASVSARLAEIVAANPVYIADGHHRYETSVAHARECGAIGTDRPEAFLLATLVSTVDPGLELLPTHRLVKDTPPALLHSLFRHLEPLFDIREVANDDFEGRLRLAVENQPVFGLGLASGTVYQMTPRDFGALLDALPDTVPPALRGLDVVLLQHLVLDAAFGIAAGETATTNRLAYTRDMAEALKLVHDGAFDAALLMCRTPVAAMLAVSDANQTMPQKSTFFYPKLASGLVFRTFDGESATPAALSGAARAYGGAV